MAINPDTTNDLRLVRTLVPASILREVDELILAAGGGYGTRQEFLLDAIQNHLVEVKYGPTEEGQLHVAAGRQLARPDEVPRIRAVTPPPIKRGRRPVSKPYSEEAPTPEALSRGPIEPIEDLAETALLAPGRGAVIEDGVAHAKEEPMFGLHNRDYPSIWAARLLAEQTQGSLVALAEFQRDATDEAWRYAAALQALEKSLRIKLTALFPTNLAKPQAAEEGFKAFAVGAPVRKRNPDGSYEASGPLFNWRAIQIAREDGRLVLGLTAAGWSLVEAMDGLTLAWPHEAEQTERFFAFLGEHAPWDAEGFHWLLQGVAERPNRVELAAHFGRWHPEWTEAMSNTNAAGYVARAREWGLVEPKLVEGRYALTKLGAQRHSEGRTR